MISSSYCLVDATALLSPTRHSHPGISTRETEREQCNKELYHFASPPPDEGRGFPRQSRELAPLTIQFRSANYRSNKRVGPHHHH